MFFFALFSKTLPPRPHSTGCDIPAPLLLYGPGGLFRKMGTSSMMPNFSSEYLSSLCLFVDLLSMFMCARPRAGAPTFTETENSEQVIGSLKFNISFFYDLELCSMNPNEQDSRFTVYDIRVFVGIIIDTFCFTFLHVLF